MTDLCPQKYINYLCGMKKNLKVYNSLTRKKNSFEPIHPGQVGMYVCGPTVYSDVHLGNVRTFISFDIIYRYLMHLGYKVRYVRNLTDVGHLLDDGQDRVSKRARLEQLEPMEIVQKYSNGFHDMMRVFNTLSPSIEPRATGHLMEQIEMVQEILDRGYAYEQNGSVYFDTLKFAEDFKMYGELSGRKIEELISETREDLKNQDEKRHPSDFAIWMKASEEHIMKWKAPWSEGFPGWHLECSVMSTKYLGQTFDIHGGGNDLKFPHHENEIAQNVGATGHAPAKYWLHANMLLMNGKKMSKSDGNTISPEELMTGESPHVSKAYHPMVVKFFMLQSHYRNTLDLTDDGLLAAEKGFNRLMEAVKTLTSLDTENHGNGSQDETINTLIDQVFDEMDDDFNTPKALAKMFELVNIINKFKDGHISLSDIGKMTLDHLKNMMKTFVFDIFGLVPSDGAGADDEVLDGLMNLIIAIRQKAREDKNWGTSDQIRDGLNELGIQLKDGKDGTAWSKN
jgi:cysteinyl-tRNA synthetase